MNAKKVRVPKKLYDDLTELTDVTFERSGFPATKDHLEQFVNQMKERFGKPKINPTSIRPLPNKPKSIDYQDKANLAKYIENQTGIKVPFSPNTSYPKLLAIADYLIER